jgi:hypothetical protein
MIANLAESICYDASEMQAIGVSLYDQQAVSREKEQSLVRIRLCSDSGTSTSSSRCETLSTQVQEVLAANPSKYCSAFGLGPASYTIPGCDNASTAGLRLRPILLREHHGKCRECRGPRKEYYYCGGASSLLACKLKQPYFSKSTHWFYFPSIHLYTY